MNRRPSTTHARPDQACKRSLALDDRDRNGVLPRRCNVTRHVMPRAANTYIQRAVRSMPCDRGDQTSDGNRQRRRVTSRLSARTAVSTSRNWFTTIHQKTWTHWYGVCSANDHGLPLIGPPAARRSVQEHLEDLLYLGVRRIAFTTLQCDSDAPSRSQSHF